MLQSSKLQSPAHVASLSFQEFAAGHMLPCHSTSRGEHETCVSSPRKTATRRVKRAGSRARPPPELAPWAISMSLVIVIVIVIAI